VLTLILAAETVARIAAGIHTAFVMVACITDPSAIFALRMPKFVIAQDSSWRIVYMISDDIRTSVLTHGAGAEVAIH
jgi:hypothetical protein